MIALALLVACEDTVYGTGPEVWSDPIEHVDDGFLFDNGRINRIDLTLEVRCCLCRISPPRNKIDGTCNRGSCSRTRAARTARIAPPVVLGVDGAARSGDISE